MSTNNKKRMRITSTMLDAMSHEMALIAAELKAAGDAITKSGKPYVEEYGWVEVEKQMKRGRNLAKNIIGAASVGGDVSSILAKVAEGAAVYETESNQAAKKKTAKKKQLRSGSND